MRHITFNIGTLIQQQDYEAIAEIIRSEQMPPKDVVELIAKDPDFARYYRETSRCSTSET